MERRTQTRVYSSQAVWRLGGLSQKTCTGWGKARPRPHH